MKGIKAICFFIIIVGILTKCINKSKTDNYANLELLKNKYSVEGINYFYETVFYEDYAGPLDKLSKWESDIWICLEGSQWECDSSFVKSAIMQINNLHLPIKLHLTEDSSLTNLIIHFGDYSYLEQKLNLDEYNLFRGIGVIPDHSIYIKSAKIGIANNAESYSLLSRSDSLRARQSTILEEISQALGIPGDSWSYKNSIFYEGMEHVVNLSNLDQEVIKLLYDPLLLEGYNRTQFEEDFRDVLYHMEVENKIVNYVNKNSIPIKYLEYIRDYCFNDGLLFKFPKQVLVKVTGDFLEQDKEFIMNSIDQLNNTSNQIELSLIPDNFENECPCIEIVYAEDSTMGRRLTAERKLQTTTMMFTRRIRGNITLSYSRSNDPQFQNSKNKLVFIAIYKMLGFPNLSNDILEIDPNGNILFNSDNKEMLDLLYNPLFPSGFSQEDLNEIIKDLK